MTDAFFELAADFMAVGPAGTARWTRVNPALAARLGCEARPELCLDAADAADPSRVRASYGSEVRIDWKTQKQDDVVYWVGQERGPDLIRELHHRLKNNFQFVVSLLSFQASRVANPDARVQLGKAEARVRAVARLHEPAYSSADFSAVEFGSYLRQLVRELSAYGDGAAAVHVEAVDVVLSMEQAAPLGLIAHELVSNALEHSDASRIEVTLEYADAGRACALQVSDDGIGMAGSVPGAGLQLVALFLEQIQGTMYTREKSGTDLSVSFSIREE